MDDQLRSTLKLMSSLASYMDVRDAGYQLVLIAYDYVVEGELIEARAHLARIPTEYFELHVHKDLADSPKRFGEALAALIDVFGLDLQLASTPKGSS